GDCRRANDLARRPRAQPVQRAHGCRAAAGKTAGKQIAAGRRLPVQHFAGAKNAGQGAYHQLFVQVLEAHAARAADRFVDRPRCKEPQRQRLDRVRQRHGIVVSLRWGAFAQQASLYAFQTDPAAQVTRHGARAAWMGDLPDQPFMRALGRQIELQKGFAIAFDRVAQRCGERVDGAAFGAIIADYEFARAFQRAVPQYHRFHRLARVAFAEVCRPLQLEAAVGGAQGRNIDAMSLQRGQPRAVGAELRPTAAAQRKYHRIDLALRFARRRIEAQSASVVAPADPAMANVNAHAAFAQAV